MRTITLHDRSVCFIAPVGKQAAAVAAPLLSFSPKAAKIVLLYSPKDTKDEKDDIASFLKRRCEPARGGKAIEIGEYSMDQLEQLEKDIGNSNLQPILLANGGLTESTIKLIGILDRLPKELEPLIAISRDEKAVWFDLEGRIRSVSDKCLQRIGDVQRNGDLSDILELARLEGICAKDGSLIGLKKTRDEGKAWKPGVPLSLEESSGFLRCTLDLGDRLSRQPLGGNQKLHLQTTLTRGPNGLMEASDWYHEFILSRQSYKDLGIEPRQIRFKNIAREFEREMFVDRIRRHGFVFSTDSAVDTPEKLIADTYGELPLPEGFDRRDGSASPRRLAVIVGILPMTTLLAIWKFKPEQLYLYYDKDSALSTLFCNRILRSLINEPWCRYAYPVGFKAGQPIMTTPPAPFSFNFTPGDKMFTTSLLLAWWRRKDMTLQKLVRTGELADIDNKPLQGLPDDRSGIRIGPPIHVLFKVHALGRGQGQARDWNTEQHHQARRQMLQILADYRNNPGENGLNIANLVDEARKQSNPSLKNIVEQELNALLDGHPNFPKNPPDKNRGFIWESITGILLAPLVDELMLNSKIVGDLDRAHGRDSEEFDILFKKGDKYGLLSCKFIGRVLKESENLFNCFEAKNNAERYLSSSFSAVIYPDVSMFSEKLKRTDFIQNCDIPGVYRKEDENLFVIDALRFPWEQTDVTAELIDKLIESASKKRL